MTRHRHFSRWALWAFVAALLLKGAMPFLATASAQMQGKSLVEVCDVHGVSLIAVIDGQPAPADDGSPDPAKHGGGKHCALGAIGTLVATEPPAHAPAAAFAPIALPSPERHPRHVPDASASWVARLKQGPPGSS